MPTIISCVGNKDIGGSENLLFKFVL